jgi:UDP-N-acetylglucosamine diphosphorylase/glucosamine-1-phosphate N-acetyltransferase
LKIIFSLLSKIVRGHRSKIVLHCRKYLEELVELRHRFTVNSLDSSKCLFINGRLLEFEKEIFKAKEDTIFVSEGKVVAAHLSGKAIVTINKKMGEPLGSSLFLDLGVKTVEVKAKFINYLWDLIKYNRNEMIKDFRWIGRRGEVRRILSDKSEILARNIFVEEGDKIPPFVVLDSRSGPIYIEKNVDISSFTEIIGPAYIGRNSKISHGYLKGAVSIGQFSKVGGELTNVIIHGYSNKQHYGFLGDSYIGEWVNLGAGTTNSNLKNNYGPVKVYTNGKYFDSGESFVGCFVGDHAKTAIGTMINTGTVIGIMANVFGTELPKFIPSFSWGVKGEYEFAKAIEAAKKVMKRRKIDLKEDEVKILKEIFKATKKERKKV